MSKTKITSKNQSGGITAQNVSFDNGSNQFNVPNDNKNEKNWKKIILIISGIIAFLASVVTILAYFDICPFNKNQ
ncbi:MAG: hypothetical protein NT144_00075 [Bacteroidia bacterium]|nr:hypothetical protein [Bacteroidia bacterium]